MRLPRELQLEPDARLALAQVLGIMSDQVMAGTVSRWDIGRLMEVEVRLGLVAAADDVGGECGTVTLGIDDAALILDGLAFTEIASADLPWVEMVRWTSDFVTGELRRHWTDAEWLTLSAAD